MAVDSEFVLMLLADARLPVAGHTQSGGLEPAVRLGVTAEQVPAYIATRLATVVRVEAATAVVALHHFSAGRPVSGVEAAWAARTPSPAMRRASRTQGRAFLRLAGRLWGDSTSVPAAAALPHVSRSTAVAAVAAAARLPATSLARLIAYDDVQTVAAAALKLLPLDPSDVSAWVLEAMPDVGVLAGAVDQLTRPDQIPANGAPQIEQWAEAHARTTRRLFSA